MIGFKLQVPSKARLAKFAWTAPFKACLVLYIAWFAEMLSDPGIGPLVPYILAIAVLALVRILPWLLGRLRRLWARLQRRQPALTGTSSAQTSAVPSDAAKDRAV